MGRFAGNLGLCKMVGEGIWKIGSLERFRKLSYILTGLPIWLFLEME